MLLKFLTLKDFQLLPVFNSFWTLLYHFATNL